MNKIVWKLGGAEGDTCNNYECVHDYINIMDKAADARRKRESAISNNNIANADTPGYKRQDVDFESALKQELGSSSIFRWIRKCRD